MAAETGIVIEEKDGVFHLSGELNEYSDFTPLQDESDPLRLNLKNLRRLNSIGIRNLLKFLNFWGSRGFHYIQCTPEFIDQVNMIPALLGINGHGVIDSLYVPFECDSCAHEHEFLGKADDFAGEEPERPCPKCGKKMFVLSDSFFVFRDR